MNEFLEKLVEWFGNIEELFTEYAPQVVDIALVLVRIDAAFNLIVGVIAAIILYPLYRVGLYCATEIRTITREKGIRWQKDEEVKFCFGLIGCVISVIAAATLALITLLNPYYWIAVINPVWGLAYKALKASGVL